MGKMTLLEVVQTLHQFNEDDTIYAVEPWACESAALVAEEPEEGGLPPRAKELGMSYFIEISFAIDFLEGWLSHQTEPMSGRAKCERLIEYAIHDV